MGYSGQYNKFDVLITWKTACKFCPKDIFRLFDLFTTVTYGDGDMTVA
jgi:hypothetical protein